MVRNCAFLNKLEKLIYNSGSIDSQQTTKKKTISRMEAQEQSGLREEDPWDNFHFWKNYLN